MPGLFLFHCYHTQVSLISLQRHIKGQQVFCVPSSFMTFLPEFRHEFRPFCCGQSNASMAAGVRVSLLAPPLGLLVVVVMVVAAVTIN